jgi:ubiquinone/menaquinone biosynthesis C-methylase UbiE
MLMTQHPGGVSLKKRVHEFWQAESCGENYAAGDDLAEKMSTQAEARYRLEPFIFDFARFAEGAGRDVLEIGVGMGADHLQWAKAHPRSLTGIDLTERALQFTERRLCFYGLKSRLIQADAEALPFPNESFDLAYSWGVLHHTPDTPQAIREVHRVLRPGGTARIMIYHTYSIAGCMLWLRHALMAGRLWRSLADVYANHLESAGTKAYGKSRAAKLFEDFSDVRMSIALSTGDTLEDAPGQQRSCSAAYSVAKRLWPRWFIKRFLRNRGLFLLIEARKDGGDASDARVDVAAQ